MTDGILSMLSLAMKAGTVKSGSFAVSEAVKGGKAALVVTALDASDRTVKDITDMCSFYDVKLVRYGSKETLGRSVGKDYRAVLAITDRNLSEAVLKKMEG